MELIQYFVFLIMIQYLTISGFRSYSQEALQKIQFDTPLTLIWGKNGSGKTTIVEALRYMIGGILPRAPLKGRAFINNCMLHEEGSAKADGCLKFRTLAGRPVFARRQALLSLQNITSSKLSQANPTIKTVNEEGKIIQITTNTTEMDKIILQILGTSKPIVEYVLLCRHQEFLWPFFQAQILKAIFEDMAEIKKFLQIYYAFQQQKKEYLRQLKIIDDKIEYHKRLYSHDIQKKQNALQEMHRVAQQSQVLTKQYQSSVKNQGVSSKIEIKNAMIKKCECFIAEANVNLQSIAEQYSKEFNANIKKKGKVKQIEQEINVFQFQKKKLAQQLYNKPSTKQKQKIVKQMGFLNTEIRHLNMQKEYLNLRISCNGYEQDMRDMVRQLNQTLSIKTKQPKLSAQEFESRKKQINLRAQIAFQEYSQPLQKQYLIKKVQQSVKKEAVKEISNFCNAILDSINKLQKRKIDEVNIILSQMWKRVYQGCDLTGIRIQTEIGRGIRYSVVAQHKTEAILDMKHSSSMGQKILASILIRLAMAKVFSPKSCILALDDPTAHLDRESINDLAEYLKKILEMNEFQNLQLIVISQDWQFIGLFRSCCQSYYEVSLDDNNFSLITKKAMA